MNKTLKRLLPLATILFPHRVIPDHSDMLRVEYSHLEILKEGPFSKQNENQQQVSKQNRHNDDSQNHKEVDYNLQSHLEDIRDVYLTSTAYMEFPKKTQFSADFFEEWAIDCAQKGYGDDNIWVEHNQKLRERNNLDPSDPDYIMPCMPGLDSWICKERYATIEVAENKWHSDKLCANF